MNNDLISRQTAIDALDEQIRQCDKALSAFDISMKDAYAVKVERTSLVAFRETLEYMPSAQPEQRWIPVTEQLPAYGEDVLISIGGYCNVGHIVSVNEEEQYNWYFSGWYHSPNDVDAWMPLPEPWKEGGE